MGTSIAVESINISTSIVQGLAGILMCYPSSSASESPKKDITTLDLVPSNYIPLKFYLDPSDSTRAYSEPFDAKLRFESLLYGSSYDSIASARTRLAISASASSRDENGVPILTELKLVNLDWSGKADCGFVCSSNTLCKALVGLESGKENPANSYLFSLQVQYKQPDSEKYEEGILTLGYTTYSNVDSSFTPPEIPRNSDTLSQVIISITKPQ